MTFPNEKAEIRAHEIEKTKAEIKVLEAKLSFLEELQNHKTLCEEAYKRVFGKYPGAAFTWTIEDERCMYMFHQGYNAAKEEKVSEYPYKKYTPEETEKSLKDAMKTAQSEGVFDQPEPETLTLKNLLKKWEFNFAFKWENPKNRSSELYEEEVERFIQMFMEWMPAATTMGWDWNDGYNSYRKTLMEKLK
jgi:hypothetical protein